jgi:hypothetical protein
MRNIEIRLPSGVSSRRLVRAIDRAIDVAGLTITLRGSLKAYPGCVHWHLKTGRESGTLEITFWPREQRAWFSIQNGRKARWIGEKMNALGMRIDDELS